MLQYFVSKTGMETYAPSVFEDIKPQLVQASRGKRFLNYIIDQVIFYLIIVALGAVAGLVFPEFFAHLDDSSLEFKLLDRLISLVLYALIMGIIETIFKGKSIGKFITGTKAVNEDGSTISAKTAFLRGLSRAVPFCAFSALGNPSYPWQDRWTHTYVIDEKQSQASLQY